MIVPCTPNGKCARSSAYLANLRYSRRHGRLRLAHGELTQCSFTVAEHKVRVMLCVMPRKQMLYPTALYPTALSPPQNPGCTCPLTSGSVVGARPMSVGEPGSFYATVHNSETRNEEPCLLPEIQHAARVMFPRPSSHLPITRSVLTYLLANPVALQSTVALRSRFPILRGVGCIARHYSTYI